jgi:hypothetical protein
VHWFSILTLTGVREVGDSALRPGSTPRKSDLTSLGCGLDHE